MDLNKSRIGPAAHDMLDADNGSLFNSLYPDIIIEVISLSELTCQSDGRIMKMLVQPSCRSSNY